MLKLAMLYFLESTLLSLDSKKFVSQEYMSMVDDWHTFSTYPWGLILYSATLEQLQSKDLREQYTNYKEQLEAKRKKATYTLYGFPFAFMASILVPHFYFEYTVVIFVVNMGFVILYKFGFEAMPRLGLEVGEHISLKKYMRCLT